MWCFYLPLYFTYIVHLKLFPVTPTPFLSHKNATTTNLNVSMIYMLYFKELSLTMTDDNNNINNKTVTALPQSLNSMKLNK